MIALAVVLLTIPLLYHLWNDRNGERPQDKTWDIILVTGLALIWSFIGYKLSGKPIIDGLLLAWGIHFAAFDYLINWILFKRGVIENPDWFGHLGKSYTDDVLRQFTPKQRLVMKLVVLGVATLVYVL